MLARVFSKRCEKVGYRRPIATFSMILSAAFESMISATTSRHSATHTGAKTCATVIRRFSTMAPVMWSTLATQRFRQPPQPPKSIGSSILPTEMSIGSSPRLRPLRRSLKPWHRRWSMTRPAPPPILRLCSTVPEWPTRRLLRAIFFA